MPSTNAADHDLPTSPLFWTHVSPYGRFELDMNAHLDLAAAVAAPLPGPRSGEPATV
ncbi:hypothetical protein ACFV4T_31495 [Streptomyces sp. NPDC059755]|uniref:hypothetical protein n=1 Tax=Streptomyces sp. NPDC059755 TaxID=3346934 RepID=UPI00365E9C2F